MDPNRKKALKDAYKARELTGGVCCIRCSGNGRYWIQATNDIESLKNRFDFSMSIKSSPDPATRAEWAKYGNGAFTFTVLEELKKGEEQTDKEFSDDINVLYEFWLEKAEKGELE